MLPLNNFLSAASEGVLMDVRTPSEYAAGHIPGAVNFPLFSDEERAEIGTLYVRHSREKAIEVGLERVGPKLAGFVREARKLSAGRPVFLYCWRGGMRSGSMAWLFNTAGIRTETLRGGYKAWRGGLEDLLKARAWEWIIVGGMTGSGKTDVLNALEAVGEQVLDLEGLARHKGSAFGSLGQNPQPTTEHFGNLIQAKLRMFDPSRPIWTEDESMSVGKAFIPTPVWTAMCGGTTFYYEIPKECRMIRLVRDYGQFPVENLKESFQKIAKRMGYDQSKFAIEYLEQGNIRKAAEIALKYYDSQYHKGENKEGRKGLLRLEMSEDIPTAAADRMKTIYYDKNH